MRRAQSVRNYGRPSLALGADDLGVLREGNESNEDVLRRQLIERDREVDRLQTQVEALQAQLAQRPPLETIQRLEKEYKSLDLLLDGTQRENERCMSEIERGKAREKMLERELAKLAGENWQSALDIAPASVPTMTGRSTMLHQRSNTLGTMPSPVLSHAQAAATPSAREEPPNSAQRQQLQIDHQQATLAHIEQVRMLIMGMEQRLQTREEKLVKSVERAESEGRRFEELRSEIANSS
ncbi:hypothetical protein MVEN_01804500 [Mycena venus]|uniref:Uncharacterized protein n=1 Tax=Mycena venus TaxID=2733690 RepID=A0A8H6XJF7_9AGAR|nr:hypothetical protein MVEN_01804500 [Mycena venus]